MEHLVMPELSRNVVIAVVAVVVVVGAIAYAMTNCTDFGLFKTCTVSAPKAVITK